MASKLKVTQKRSTIGCNPKQRQVLKGLGLRRINHSVTVQNEPSFRGMIKKVSHLVIWETIDGE